MIYEPAEDSLLIQKYIKKYAKGKVIDIGTGSGILALEAKKYTKDVTASDINPECEANMKNHKIKFILSDIFENIRDAYDLIIFNPPYLPEDESEPNESKKITTAGKKGNEIIVRFLKEAKLHLNHNGKILLLVSSLTHNVPNIFKDYKCKLLKEQFFFFEKLMVYLIWI